MNVSLRQKMCDFQQNLSSSKMKQQILQKRAEISQQQAPNWPQQLDTLLHSFHTHDQQSINLEALNEFLWKFPKQDPLSILKAYDLAVKGMVSKEPWLRLQGAKLYESIFIIDQKTIEKRDPKFYFLREFSWTLVSQREFFILNQLVLVICELTE